MNSQHSSQLKVVNLSIDSLIPYANNSRTHSKDQISKIASSIKEFGFNDPIAIDNENGIIAGHGRLEAAKLLGLNEVPVIQIGHLSKAQQKAYIIAHNRIALDAGWDNDLLQVELQELKDLDFDLAMTGFNDKEFDALLNPETIKEGLKDDDDVPVVDHYPSVVRGDIWLLGNHRLRCGDSTNAIDVQELLRNERMQFCFTSPPYADQRDYEDGINIDVSNISTFIRTSFHAVNIYAVNLGLSRKDHEINCYWNEYITEAKNCELKLLSWNIWDKEEAGSIGNQSAMFAISHEFIFVFGKEKIELNKTYANKSAGIKANHTGHRQKDGSIKKAKDSVVREYSQLKTVTQLHAQKARDDINHPARFPVELPETYILACSNPNDNVYDPFGGSGSTLIACEKINRKCFMMEISPLYCEVIIKRWQDFVGQKAILESTGQTFEDVANSRKA